MFIAALLTIPAVVIESSSTSADAANVARILNWVIWLAFATETGVMLVVSPDRRGWLKRHPLNVALVILTPPFAPATLQSARILRLLPVLRLAAAGHIIHRVISPQGLRQAALLTLLLILGAAAAFRALENGHHPQPITLWDGLWWAVETVTTVGYGDIYPVTDAGRVIAMVVMFTGIGFVALLTGSIAQQFLADKSEAPDDEMLRLLRDMSARLEALETRAGDGDAPGGGTRR